MNTPLTIFWISSFTASSSMPSLRTLFTVVSKASLSTHSNFTKESPRTIRGVWTGWGPPLAFSRRSVPPMNFFLGSWALWVPVWHLFWVNLVKFG